MLHTTTKSFPTQPLTEHTLKRCLNEKISPSQSLPSGKSATHICPLTPIINTNYAAAASRVGTFMVIRRLSSSINTELGATSKFYALAYIPTLRNLIQCTLTHTHSKAIIPITHHEKMATTPPPVSRKQATKYPDSSE